MAKPPSQLDSNPSEHGGVHADESIDAYCDEYERRWREGVAPVLDAYLSEIGWPAASASAVLIEELVCLDMEHRWRLSSSTIRDAAAVKTALRPPTAQDYVRRYLAVTSRPPASWLKVEYRCRRRWGSSTDVEEFESRYTNDPDVAEVMRAVKRENEREPRANPKNSESSGRSSCACPHCLAAIELPANADAADVRCHKCNFRFRLTAPTASAAAPESGVVDHFELLEVLGTGGFGVVHKARDTRLNRLVAVKFPKQGSLTEEEVARIQREASAVARLRHPNIVPLFEVGFKNGAPYLVTEYIQGVSLADRSDGSLMLSRDVAELCRKLALALHHAHEMGIVHRDIKPANVMIDNKWEPHLMDFGLAKRDASDITLTVDGQIMGTPAYMSPEQARGDIDAIGPRSDVYSLGAILFELLTGELPFRGTLQMVLQQVVHDDPPTPRSLNRLAPLDLQTICLKCLEKDPARRFSSAQDLADELRRFLDGRPIESRPISTLQRHWRWCKRNVLAASLAATAVFLLIAVAAVATFGYITTSKALAEKRESFATSEEVSSFLESVFLTTSPLQSDDKHGFFFSFRNSNDPDPAAKTLLERGVERIDDQLRDQPRVQMRLLSSMGNAFHGIGSYDRAAQLFQRALAIARQQQPPDSVEVATAMHSAASALGYAGHYDEAEKLVRQAIALITDSDEPAHPSISSMKLSLGMLLTARNQFSEAEALLEEVVSERERQAGPNDPSVMFALEALTCLYLNSGKHDDAHRTLVRLLQSASVNRNGDWRKAATIVGDYQRGLHELNAGDAAKAVPKLASTVNDVSELLGERHPFTAIVLFDYGRCLRVAGDQQAAIDALERAIGIGATIVQSKHPLLLYGRTGLVAAYFDVGRLDDAEALLAEMKPHVVETWGADSWQFADHCAMMAVAAFEADRPTQAMRYADTAIAVGDVQRVIADDDLGGFRADIWRRLATRLDESGRAAALQQAAAVEEARAQAGGAILPGD